MGSNLHIRGKRNGEKKECSLCSTNSNKTASSARTVDAKVQKYFKRYPF